MPAALGVSPALLSLCLLALVPSSGAIAKPPPPPTYFTSSVSCFDASKSNESGASIDCQSCTAMYDNDGNSMADVSVSVVDRPGQDGSLIGCDSDSGGLNGLISAVSYVRPTGEPGAIVPIVITYSVSVTLSGENCSGGTVVAIGGNDGSQNSRDKAGSQSGKLRFNAVDSQLVPIEVSAAIQCIGCSYRDVPGGDREFFDCANSGEAIADPVPSIDPDWAYADLFVLEAYDASTGSWKPTVPATLDVDGDGVLQPEDCNDFDPNIRPGVIDIPDNDVDEDCNGGDARAEGAEDGATCTDDIDCASGTCVTGICCESRCGDGAEDDCQSCLFVETGSADGTCAPLAAGTVCRAASGLCDLVETCDGERKTCTGDFKMWEGEVCRPSTGACDPAETCVIGGTESGTDMVCPDDVREEHPDNGVACSTGLGGVCEEGALLCGACVPVHVEVETCNGLDDDCNGVVDDGFELVGAPCMVGVGACAAPGVTMCSLDGLSVVCDGEPYPEGVELCNGQDDDCDGEVDEGFQLGEPCVAGVGACAGPGVLQCDVFDAAAPAACVADVFIAGSEETCNGIDDDCDGEVDEGVCVNSPVDDLFGAVMDTALVVPASVGLIANDELITEVIAVLDQGPAVGTLDLAPDGSFEYLPAPCSQGDVTFTYRLYDPLADFTSPPATVTIAIAPRPTTFGFELVGSVVPEGGEAVAMVRRRGSCASQQVVTCYTQANTATTADFVATTSVLTFAPGVGAVSCVVPVVDDALVEGDESFYLRLKTPSAGATLAAQRVHVVTVADDDRGGTFAFAVRAVEVGEGAGSVTLVVTRSDATANTSAQVKWAASAGSASVADFATQVGDTRVLVFEPGQTERSLVLDIVDDALAEGNESFRVTLSAPTGGAILGADKQAIVTIIDDDDAGAISWVGGLFEVAEGAGTLELGLVRSGFSPGSSATVKWSAASGSAGAADWAYLADDSRVVTFGPDESEARVTLTIVNDDLVEGLESFRVALASPSGGARLGASRFADVLVHDDDQATRYGFASPLVIVGEGDGVATLVVTRTDATLAGAVSVRWTPSLATSPADFTAGGPIVVPFLPGQSEALIEVPIVDDDLAEGDETFNATLSVPLQGFIDTMGRLVGLIRDDDL